MDSPVKENGIKRKGNEKLSEIWRAVSMSCAVGKGIGVNVIGERSTLLG